VEARSRTHSPLPPASYGPTVAHHERLVHAVVRRQWGGSLSYNEQVQAGRIGLWHALQHFDPNRGYTLSTYAWPAIARHVWRQVALTNPSPLEVLTPNSPLPAPDIDDLLQRHEVYDCLHRLIDRLPSHLRQVVLLYYGLDDHPPHSLRQLGLLLGISHEMVRQRLLAALVFLRHPAHSLPLRQLLGRNTVADYQHAHQLAQSFLRRRGGRNDR